MGSLTSSGTAIAQPDLRFRMTRGRTISKVEFANDRTITESGIANTSISTNREVFTADATSSGNLLHHVTRKISPIHVSVSKREAVLQQNKTGEQIASGVLGGDTLGPMETITERKVFFLDSDRNKSSSFSDLTIYSASGVAVGDADGTTDTDITPNATYDQ